MSEPTTRATGGVWRERPHHTVTRVGSTSFEETPCFCWAAGNHRVGEEQNPAAAAVPSPETAPTTAPEVQSLDNFGVDLNSETAPASSSPVPPHPTDTTQEAHRG